MADHEQYRTAVPDAYGTASVERDRQAPHDASPQYRVAIVGGGAAGVSVAAALRRRLGRHETIALIEPSPTHCYQPGLTLVGGGLWPLERTRRPTAGLIPPGVEWVQEHVTVLDPERNRLELTDGRTLPYDYLVVCPGLVLDWQRIPGLPEALGDGRVCSIYDPHSAADTAQCLRAFRGGRALFTQPPMPIKCPGAPQKIVYLAADQWRQRRDLARTHIEFALAADALFSVPEYVPTLERVAARYEVGLHCRTRLTAVDGPKARATLVRTDSVGATTEWTQQYDLLHAVPPQGPPPFVRDSALADAAGWVDVDPATLQHRRYANVFGLGDATSVPTSKTAAAVRAQVPVVVANLEMAMRGAQPALHYSGYASCPLITGYGRVVLTEFVYGRRVRPSLPWDSTRERRSAWWLKTRFLPWMYWRRLLRGRDLPLVSRH